jgi:hypothetical protein
MQKQDFAERTMQFGLRAIRVVESLPNSETARIIGGFFALGQLLVLTIVLLCVADREPISSRKWELWKRNATRLFIGCKC